MNKKPDHEHGLIMNKVHGPVLVDLAWGRQFLSV